MPVIEIKSSLINAVEHNYFSVQVALVALLMVFVRSAH